MKGVWSLSPLAAAVAAAASGPALQAIYSSHGAPIVVKPSIYDYTVLLNVPTSSVALIPKIMPEGGNVITSTTSTTTTTPAAVNETAALHFWEQLKQQDAKWSSFLRPSSESNLGAASMMCDTRVRMSWNGMAGDWLEAEPSAMAMMKQIPLPENGEDLLVKIDLDKMTAPRTSSQYTVRFKQSMPAPTGLMGIEAYAEGGSEPRKCVVGPTLSEDVQKYFVYVNPPHSKRLTLNLKCRGSNSEMTVNGKRHTKRDGQGFHHISLARELDHHTQLVQVTCSRPNKYQPPNALAPSLGHVEKRYAIHILSDYTDHELDAMPTKIYLPAVDKYCQFDADKLKYLCPDPQLPFHLVQFQTENEPTVKYTLFNKGRSVELRLLNKKLSLPFTYSGAFTVRHEAGRNYRDYPLEFDGSMMRSFLGVLGSILGTLLFVLTGALLVIIGASSVFTLGFPIGATEIAGTLAFIIQYLCFSQTLKGSPRLTEFTDPLKWFTLFAPAPISLSNDDCSAPWASAPSVRGSRVGDLKDYHNAQGAMLWGLVLLGAFLCIHCGVIIRFKVFEKGYTMPHHVKFGGWENRVLHSLLFPMVVAASYIFTLATRQGNGTVTTAAQVCPIYKGLAMLILLGFFGWICFEAFDIHSMVSEGRVLWVWNASVKEDGQLEDESGYWTDLTADQIVTQPVNRAASPLRRLFPFTWVSPVADIVPQVVVSNDDKNKTLNPPAKYRSQRYKEPSYALAKTPQCVEIVRCRKPGGLCRGQRLIAGLLRTTWLDVLFTYESLTQLHSNVTGKYYTSTTRKTHASEPTRTVSEDIQSRSGTSANFVIPAMVKTSQMSGPLTGGRAMFFFDGTRVPFIRIADCLYRFIVGVCLGIVISAWSTGHQSRYASLCFSLIAVVSVAMLVYTSVTRPYTRAVEGWLSVATLGTVAVSAAAFAMFYIITGEQRDEATVLADLSLWLVIGCCFLLGAYSLVIDSSILSAVLCPPLDETKFLEKLANVAVAVSDNKEGRRVETPGFSKYPVREILMQATQTGAGRVHVSVTPSKQEPCLEFTERQIRQACQANGALPLPAVTVIARSRRERLGYKWLHQSVDAFSDNAMTDFLTQDETKDAYTGTVAREITRHVKYQTETRGRNGQTLLTINIAPPQQQ